jgi:hypothetical protein
MCATRTNVILIGVAGIMPSGEIASDDQACADHRKGSGEPQTHFSHGTPVRHRMRIEERSMKLRTVGETTIHTDLVTRIRPAVPELEAVALAFAGARGGNPAACRSCKGEGKDHNWATAATCPRCDGSGVTAA